jgi:RHS repeat-associated protein
LLLEAHPGNNVLRAATGRVLGVGPAEFIYEASLPSAFEAQAGALYWLVVLNNTAGQPANWGIGSSASGNGNLAGSNDGGMTWGPAALDTAFELLTADSAVGNPYLFAGRRYDSETGFYDYRSRYLDPMAGRFITREAERAWGDSGNLGNGFTYAGNNPWGMQWSADLQIRSKWEDRGRPTRPKASGQAELRQLRPAAGRGLQASYSLPETPLPGSVKLRCAAWAAGESCASGEGLCGPTYTCRLNPCGIGCAPWFPCPPPPKQCRPEGCLTQPLRLNYLPTNLRHSALQPEPVCPF